jgi:hypothetical protein
MRVIRVVLTPRPSLLVYPDKQTFSVSVGMSQRCQKRSIYDSPSTAHLTASQAPAMPSVHASLDHIATVVIIVVRVEAEAETSPEVATEVAIMETSPEVAITKSTAVKTATVEPTSEAAAMESTTAEAATMKSTAVKTATVESTSDAAAMETAAAHAASVATSTTTAAKATTTTSQRHRWRNQANGRNCR